MKTKIKKLNKHIRSALRKASIRINEGVTVDTFYNEKGRTIFIRFIPKDMIVEIQSTIYSKRDTKSQNNIYTVKNADFKKFAWSTIQAKINKKINKIDIGFYLFKLDLVLEQNISGT